MKLRNKLSGEIKEFTLFDGNELQGGVTLESLTKEWCDYVEPKVGYIVDPMEELCVSADDSGYEESDVERAKELGIWFETEEEAEKAVEKLKAFNRLKDKGFKFEGWQDLEACDETEKLVANRIVDGENIVGFKMDDYHDCFKDLNICFGGEE